MTGKIKGPRPAYLLKNLKICMTKKILDFVLFIDVLIMLVSETRFGTLMLRFPSEKSQDNFVPSGTNLSWRRDKSGFCDVLKKVS